MMNQPSSHSTDSLAAPSCHGHSLSCSSTAPWKLSPFSMILGPILCTASLQLHTLVSGVGKTNFTLDISAAARQRKRPPAGHVGAAALPGIPPYLLLLFLVHVFVSVHGVRRSYTCQCVCRVSLWYPVCTSAASVMSMVCV